VVTARPAPCAGRSNLGRTGLRVRPRRGDAMAAFDALPADLRRWLAAAAMPWRPRSVARAFADALARTNGDRAAALARLSAIEQRLLVADSERRLRERARSAEAEASRPRTATGRRP
jgi:hypothetical protein